MVSLGLPLRLYASNFLENAILIFLLFLSKIPFLKPYNQKYLIAKIFMRLGFNIQLNALLLPPYSVRPLHLILCINTLRKG